MVWARLSTAQIFDSTETFERKDRRCWKARDSQHDVVQGNLAADEIPRKGAR